LPTSAQFCETSTLPLLRRTLNFFTKHIVAVKHFHKAHLLSLKRSTWGLGQTKDLSNPVTYPQQWPKADGRGRAEDHGTKPDASPDSPSAANHPQPRDCRRVGRVSLLLVTSTGHPLPQHVQSSPELWKPSPFSTPFSPGRYMQTHPIQPLRTRVGSSCTRAVQIFPLCLFNHYSLPC